MPTWQRQDLKKYLQVLFKQNNVSDFKLTENYSLKTETNQMRFDSKPSDTYNSIFNNVDTDIKVLYNIINALSNQVYNYDLLIESLVKNVDRDIDSIKSLIKQEQYKRNDVEELLVEDFANVEFAETMDTETAYLFCDRDSKTLSSCSFNETCTLHVKESNNLLLGNDGTVLSKIIVTGYQGLPNKTIHEPSKAIDNSLFSLWDAGHLSDKRIELGYSIFNSYGHYIDFTILLPKYTNITEINLTHSSEFPIDVCQIFVNDKPVLSEPIQVDNRFWQILNNAYGEEIRFIIAQRNYSAGYYTSNAKQEDLEDLWYKAYRTSKYDETNSNKDFDYYWEKYKKSIKNYISKLIGKVV